MVTNAVRDVARRANYRAHSDKDFVRDVMTASINERASFRWVGHNRVQVYNRKLRTFRFATMQFDWEEENYQVESSNMGDHVVTLDDFESALQYSLAIVRF